MKGNEEKIIDNPGKNWTLKLISHAYKSSIEAILQSNLDLQFE